jgi:HAD superfamily hydrolase (TIGR01509 family)
MGQIKAVIFDLDGVLADLVEAHYESLNEALAACGHPVITREMQESVYNGLPTKTKMKLLGITDPDEIQKVYDKKQELTIRAIKSVINVDPGLIAVMQQLKDRGYKLAVASNAIRATVDLVCRRVGICAFFDVTLSNQDVRNPKPHPEIYLKACEVMGIQPWEALVVEDSPHGQRAAIEAGTRLCAVSDPADVTAERILRSIAEHENLGYLLPPPEARKPGFCPGAGSSRT